MKSKWKGRKDICNAYDKVLIFAIFKGSLENNSKEENIPTEKLVKAVYKSKAINDEKIQEPNYKLYHLFKVIDWDFLKVHFKINSFKCQNKPNLFYVIILTTYIMVICHSCYFSHFIDKEVEIQRLTTFLEVTQVLSDGAGI